MFFIVFLACLFSTQHLYSAAAAADTVTYYAVNHPDNTPEWNGWKPVKSYYSSTRTPFGELIKKHVFTLWRDKAGNQSFSLWNNDDGNPQEYVTFAKQRRTGPEIYRANGYCALLSAANDVHKSQLQTESGFGPLSDRLFKGRDEAIKNIEQYKKWTSEEVRSDQEHCLYVFRDSPEKKPVLTDKAPNPFWADYLHQEARKMEAFEKKHATLESPTTERRSTAV